MTGSAISRASKASVSTPVVGEEVTYRTPGGEEVLALVTYVDGRSFALTAFTLRGPLVVRNPKKENGAYVLPG